MMSNKLTYKEFLQKWNESNNPFFPSDMRWDIQTTYKVLKDYDEYLKDFNSTLLVYDKSYTIEEIEKIINNQINDFKHDLRESTSTYVKTNCEGAVFGLKRLKEFINNLKQIK